MRRADHLLKTMTAARSCINNCRCDAAPLAALENYLQELRMNPDWTADEIAEVESCARKALQSLCCTAGTTTGASATSATVASHF